MPAEAEAIHEAVQAIIAGASLHEIARRGDAAGLARLQGSLWREQPTKARDVLTSWRIAGVPVHKGQPLPEAEAQWPAIVSRELEQVRNILLAPELRVNAHRAARRSLLSGIATCGACGSPLRSSTHEGRLGMHAGSARLPRASSHLYKGQGAQCQVDHPRSTPIGVEDASW